MEDLQEIETSVFFPYCQVQALRLVIFFPFYLFIFRKWVDAVILTFSPPCGCGVEAPGCAGEGGGTEL